MCMNEVKSAVTVKRGRGPGKVSKRILASMKPYPLRCSEIAQRVYGEKPDKADICGTSAKLSTLEKVGLVASTESTARKGYKLWALTFAGMEYVAQLDPQVCDSQGDEEHYGE